MNIVKMGEEALIQYVVGGIQHITKEKTLIFKLWPEKGPKMDWKFTGKGAAEIILLSYKSVAETAFILFTVF